MVRPGDRRSGVPHRVTRGRCPCLNDDADSDAHQRRRAGRQSSPLYGTEPAAALVGRGEGSRRCSQAPAGQETTDLALRRVPMLTRASAPDAQIARFRAIPQVRTDIHQAVLVGPGRGAFDDAARGQGMVRTELSWRGFLSVCWLFWLRGSSGFRALVRVSEAPMRSARPSAIEQGMNCKEYHSDVILES